MSKLILGFIVKHYRAFLVAGVSIFIFGYIGIQKLNIDNLRAKNEALQNDNDALDEKLYYTEQVIISLNSKIEADAKIIKSLKKIRENIQNAHNTKDDGAVAPVLSNTLNSLHALQNR